MDQNNLAEVSGQPAESVPVDSPSHSEKMVPQSEVEKMIRHSNARVAEKARREALENYGVQSITPSQTSQVMPSNTNSANEEDRIGKIVSDRIQALLDQQTQAYYNQQGERIAQEFQSKLDAGKHNYEDFDTVVQDLNLRENPHIVALGNLVDNTTDVMYELAQNPIKVASLEILWNKNPALAQKEMLKMSDSIKKNQAAKQEKQPNEPLSRIQPTPIAADNGSTSLKDLKRIYLG